MESLDLIYSLCVKIGNLKNTPKYRFIKKYKLKRDIINNYNKFFNLPIFEQSEGIASVLISLFYNQSNKTIITDDIEQFVHITQASIEMYLIPELVSYIPKENTFDVDTSYNNADGYKFKYTKDSILPKNIDDEWNNIKPKMQDRYMRIINSIANVLNNPVIINEISENHYTDPFAD